MVVDDDPASRKLLSSFLTPIGCMVRAFGSGEEAVRAVEMEKWDLILLDISMPGMDGFKVLERIRRDHPIEELPFVLVTGRDDGESYARGLALRANDFITKPVDRAEFLARIGTILSLRWARLELEDRLRELGESERKYRLLAENLSDVVWVLDMNLRYTYVSPSIIRLRGFTPDEVTGQMLVETLTVPSMKVAMETLEEEMEQETTGSANPERERVLNLEMKRKDGSVVPTEVKMRFLRGPGDRPVGIQGITRDITERREAEAKLRQSEEHLRQVQKFESIGKLAGGIAHDFNNLLTVITSYCELLGDKYAGTEPLSKYIGEIRRAGERAADLTGQLLAFSRRQMLNPIVLNLNRLVWEMMPMLKRLIGEDIELVVDFDPVAGNVRADSSQVSQVVMNLVVNARDAMPGGGKLVLETRNVQLDEKYAMSHIAVVPGPYVMLGVSDTGTGMDADTRAHIFEPFFTTKEKGKGTGLGLSTVYGIVKQSGGNIWAYSEPGHGTSFKIYLPLVREAAEPAGRTESGHAPGGTETILLAEDEDVVRIIARDILRECGYRVIETPGPAEALAACRNGVGTFDLLLTDVVMPGKTGVALYEELTAERPGLRVLFMSGYTDQAVMQQGIIGKGAPFIQKPFTPTSLSRKVREVLDSSSPRLDPLSPRLHSDEVQGKSAK